MTSNSESARQLSPTKRQLEEAAGADLLNLLCAIPPGARSDPAEVQRLRDWLFAHADGDLPAVTRLMEIIVRIMEAGVITEPEGTELAIAIERVLPLTQQGVERQGAAGDAPRAWREEPMSELQRKFIQSLGAEIAAGATQGEAARLIDQSLRKLPLTNRQQMVLRFWNNVPNPGDGPREVADWQERFYSEDPDRKAAWELYKQESDERRVQGDPLRVPTGAGRTYLARVKAGGKRAVAQPGPNSDAFRSHEAKQDWRWLVWTVTAVGVAAIWFLLLRPPPKAAAPKPAPVNKEPVVVTPPPRPEAPAPRPVVPNTKPPAAIVEIPRTDATPPNGSIADLKTFARSINFTALLTVGGEQVAMINGQRFRTGDKIGPAGEYTVTEINPVRRSVILKDQWGNAVRRMIE